MKMREWFKLEMRRQKKYVFGCLGVLVGSAVLTILSTGVWIVVGGLFLVSSAMVLVGWFCLVRGAEIVINKVEEDEVEEVKGLEGR